MLYNVFCYTQHVLSFSFHLFSTAYYWYRRNWADGQNAMDTLWCLGHAWSIGLSRWSLQRDTWRLVRRSRASIMRPSHRFYCDHAHCLYAMQDRTPTPRIAATPIMRDSPPETGDDKEKGHFAKDHHQCERYRLCLLVQRRRRAASGAAYHNKHNQY